VLVGLTAERGEEGQTDYGMRGHERELHVRGFTRVAEKLNPRLPSTRHDDRNSLEVVMEPKVQRAQQFEVVFKSSMSTKSKDNRKALD
jgi:hypothetical protein